MQTNTLDITIKGSADSLEDIAHALAEGAQGKEYARAGYALVMWPDSSSPFGTAPYKRCTYDLAPVVIEDEVIFSEEQLARSYRVFKTVTMSKYTRSSAIVRAVEKVIMEMRGEERAAYEAFLGSHPIYTVQCLQYDAGITGDPYSKAWPTDEEIIRRVLRRSGIKVVRTEA